MPTPDLGALPLVLGSGVVGSALTGLFGWLSTRTKAKSAQPADLLTAQTAFQEALAAQTTAFIEALQKDRAQLEEEVRNLKAEVAELKADNEICQAEGRGMRQRVDSLESVLRREGIPIPEATAPGVFLVVEGNKATVLTPTAKP